MTEKTDHDEEFINVDELNITYEEKNNDDDNGKANDVNIYQIQPILNERYSKFCHVGILNKLHDVIINKFDLSLRINCILLSCMYDTKLLNLIESHCRFPICKILINYNDGKKLEPICTINFNFHTFTHAQHNKSILEYVSEKLYGYYSITLNHNKKITILEVIKEVDNINFIFNKMIEYLRTPVVENIIKIY